MKDKLTLARKRNNVLMEKFRIKTFNKQHIEMIKKNKVGKAEGEIKLGGSNNGGVILTRDGNKIGENTSSIYPPYGWKGHTK